MAMPVSVLSQAAFTLVGRKYRAYSQMLDSGPCCSLFLRAQLSSSPSCIVRGVQTLRLATSHCAWSSYTLVGRKYRACSQMLDSGLYCSLFLLTWVRFKLMVGGWCSYRSELCLRA